MGSFLHKKEYEYKVKAYTESKETKRIIYTFLYKYFKYLKKQVNYQKNQVKNLHFFSLSCIISLPFILFKQKQKMGRLAEKIDKRRKNYHAFREDVDSYFTARIIVSDMQD